MELKEKKQTSQLIYQGKIIDVYKDEVLCPNGKMSTRELIRHCKAVCILAKKDDKFILEQQYRYPYDEVIYELPAGKLDENEDLASGAIRELEEETGYHANNIEMIGKMYPACGYSDEVIYLFYSDDLEKREVHLDEDEAINYGFYSMQEIENMVKEGLLVDGKSLCLLYQYKLLKQK